MKSRSPAEENRDSVSLDFSRACLINKDSTSPAWNEFVSCLFLLFFFLNAGHVTDLGGGEG